MTNGTASEFTLLPCPFCGGKVKMRVSDDDSYVIECGNHDWPSISAKRENTTIAADVLMCSWGDGEDAKQALIEAWNTRVAVTDHDCGKCKERQGYYLDAETIQRQQERIAELQVKVAYWVGQYDNAIDERDVRDVLIRDMMPFMCEDDGIERIETRIRELGIEVDE